MGQGPTSELWPWIIKPFVRLPHTTEVVQEDLRELVAAAEEFRRTAIRNDQCDNLVVKATDVGVLAVSFDRFLERRTPTVVDVGNAFLANGERARRAFDEADVRSSERFVRVLDRAIDSTEEFLANVEQVEAGPAARGDDP